MSEENGLDLLQFLSKSYPNIPVVIISTEGKREIVTKALDLGAKDYILKPFDKNQLLYRTNSLITNSKENIKLKDSKEKKNYQDNNFNIFINSLKINLSLEINRSFRSNLPFSIIKYNIDISHDKNIKNKLKEIITTEIRDIDQVYIVAEDSYVLLLPLTDLKGVKIFISKIQGKVKGIVLEKILTFPDCLEQSNFEVEKKKNYFKEVFSQLEI